MPSILTLGLLLVVLTDDCTQVNLFTLLFVAFGGGMLYVAGIIFDAIDDYTTLDLIQYDFGKYAVTAFAGCLTAMVFVVSLIAYVIMSRWQGYRNCMGVAHCNTVTNS